MKTVRLNAFETNSSSMHALVVACGLKHDNFYSEYLKKELKRYHKNGKYYIIVECNENMVDKSPFDTRKYINHSSINDKLIYYLATVIQHHQRDQQYYETKNKSIEELNQLSEKYSNQNKQASKRFIEDIEWFSDILKYDISKYLGIKQEDIIIEIKYYIDPVSYYINYSNNDNDWFSTGCYNNEEFYYAIFSSYAASEWICNPYSAVLANTDECDYEEEFEWEQQAKKLLEISFKKSENTYGDEYELDKNQKKKTRLNRGKVIFPLGG